jgi:hypothetical protein
MVQALLGHAKVGITLDTYSHLIPSLGRDTAVANGCAAYSLWGVNIGTSTPPFGGRS